MWGYPFPLLPGKKSLFIPYTPQPNEPVWIKVLDKSAKLCAVVFPLIVEDCRPLAFGWNSEDANTMYIKVSNPRIANDLCNDFTHVVVAEIVRGDPRCEFGSWHSGSFPPIKTAYRIQNFVCLNFLAHEGTSAEFFNKTFESFAQMRGHRLLRVRGVAQLELYAGSRFEAEKYRDRYANTSIPGMTIQADCFYMPDTEETHAYIQNLGSPPTTAGLRAQDFCTNVLHKAREWAIADPGKTLAKRLGESAVLEMDLGPMRVAAGHGITRGKENVPSHPQPPSSSNFLNPKKVGKLTKSTKASKTTKATKTIESAPSKDPSYSLADAWEAQRRLESSSKTWGSQPVSEILALPELPPFDPLAPECSKATILKDVLDWHHTAGRPPPSQQVLNPLFAALPSDRQKLQAFDTVRRGFGDPLMLLKLLENGQTIPIDRPAFYFLLLRVIVAKGVDGLERVKNIDNEQRRRICKEIGEHIAYLKEHHPEIHVYWATYTGFTVFPKNRPQLDMINISFSGTPTDDKRPALSQMMDVAAGVSSLSDEAVFSWKAGRSIMHAEPAVLDSKRLPSVVRILFLPLTDQPNEVWRNGETVGIGMLGPMKLNIDPGGETHYELDPFLRHHFPSTIADVEDPLAEIQFLADATGPLGGSLQDSARGRLLFNAACDLQGGKEHPLRNLNWHLPGHISNDTIVTSEEVARVRAAISPHCYLIILVGTLVSLSRACEHLFKGQIVASGVRLFKMYGLTYDDAPCLLMALPHPGCLNHTGPVPWIMAAFNNGMALGILVAATISRLKKAHGPVLSAPILGEALDRLRATPLMQQLENRLSNASIRTAWKGDIAVEISRTLELGGTFEEGLRSAWNPDMRPLLTDFSRPTPDNPRFNELLRIAGAEGKESESGVRFSILVPHVPSLGTEPCVVGIRLDAHWRGPESEAGWLYVDEVTLHLVFRTTEGEILVGTDGAPFKIPRWKWLVSVGFGSQFELFKKHCLLMGIWTDLREYEEREIIGRSGTGKPMLRLFSHTVHTLDCAEIEVGVASGDITLIPLGKAKINIFFWKESVKGFELVFDKVPMPWLESGCGDATHFALAYDFDSSIWEFPLYKVGRDNDYDPIFLKKHAKTFSSHFQARSAIVKHGESTELFKGQRAQRPTKLQLRCFSG